MGNCECLQGQEERTHIEVHTNSAYHKDYTQPGNFKGGNQFLLLDNDDTEDRENKLKFQTHKETKYERYEVENIDNGKEEDRENDIVVDDNRVQHIEEEEDVVCASTTIKVADQDNLTKKSKNETYTVNTFKHYQDGTKKPDQGTTVQVEGKVLYNYL